MLEAWHPGSREWRELDRALTSPEGLGQGRSQVDCMEEEVQDCNLKDQQFTFWKEE